MKKLLVMLIYFQNICDILDQLGGAKYFSTLDLASGFHQIPMDPDSQSKTAFSTPLWSV